jgi:hypothetical protein
MYSRPGCGPLTPIQWTTVVSSGTVIHNVRGTVRDGLGMLVVGAEVWAGVPGEPSYVTTTNEHGEYDLLVPAGTYELGVRIKTYENVAGISAGAGIEHLAVTEDVAEDFSFPTQIGSVNIRAVEAGGEPASGAEISVYEREAALWQSSTTPEGTPVSYGGSGLQNKGCKPKSARCTVRAVVGAEIEAQAQFGSGAHTERGRATAAIPSSELTLTFP